MLLFWHTQPRRVALGATGLLVLILAVPVPEHPFQETPLLDKWTHFVLFCALGWTYLNASFRSLAGPARTRLFVGWGATVLMGGLTEGLQRLLPWRSAEWLDAGANAIGATLALLTWLLLKRSLSSQTL